MLHNFVHDQGTDVVVVTPAAVSCRGGLPRAYMVVSPAMSDSIDVVINGETRTVVEGTTVAALIVELGFGDRRVAVERNREVVPRAQHATTLLASGDQVEIVTFVGGG